MEKYLFLYVFLILFCISFTSVNPDLNKDSISSFNNSLFSLQKCKKAIEGFVSLSFYNIRLFICLSIISRRYLEQQW